MVVTEGVLVDLIFEDYTLLFPIEMDTEGYWAGTVFKINMQKSEPNFIIQYSLLLTKLKIISST